MRRLKSKLSRMKDKLTYRERLRLDSPIEGGDRQSQIEENIEKSRKYLRDLKRREADLQAMREE